MPVSLHSHSGQFCRHAKGNLEKVVLEAIGQSFKVYGLSEHIPRYRREELYPEEEDLQLEDLEKTFEAYIQEAIRLRDKYEDRIQLLIGLETEYITLASLDKLSDLLERYSDFIEYLVGSVHHVNGIPIDFDRETFDKCLASFPDQAQSPEGLTQLEQLFNAYFDAQYELMKRVKPEVIGHIDLCRLYLPDASFQHEQVWAKVERNVRFAIEYGALFEVNAAAFRKGWKSAYPAPDVLKLILSLGGRLTLSDDSHGPQAVGLHYTELNDYLKAQDVVEIWYLSSQEKRQEGRSTEKVRRKSTKAARWPNKWSEESFWTSREM